METVETIFVKTTNADGTEGFREVPLAELDVREHPAHKTALDEAVKARKKAAALKKAAEDATAGEGSGEPVPDPKVPAPEPVHIPTVDELIAEMEKRQATKQAQTQQENDAWTARVNAAALKHGLPASAIPLLSEARNPEVMAEALAKAPLSFAQNPAGGNSADELAAYLERVDERLFGDKPKGS